MKLRSSFRGSINWTSPNGVRSQLLLLMLWQSLCLRYGRMSVAHLTNLGATINAIISSASSDCQNLKFVHLVRDTYTELSLKEWKRMVIKKFLKVVGSNPSICSKSFQKNDYQVSFESEYVYGCRNVIVDKRRQSQYRLQKCVAESRKLVETVALKSTNISEPEGDMDLFQGWKKPSL